MSQGSRVSGRNSSSFIVTYVGRSSEILKPSLQGKAQMHGGEEGGNRIEQNRIEGLYGHFTFSVQDIFSASPGTDDT